MEALTDEDCAVVLDDKWLGLEYPREKAVARSELLDGRNENSARNTRKIEKSGLAMNPNYRYVGADGRERAKEKVRPRGHLSEQLYYASLKEKRGRKAIHGLRQWVSHGPSPWLRTPLRPTLFAAQYPFRAALAPHCFLP